MSGEPELFEVTPTTVCPACNMPVKHAGKLTLKVSGIHGYLVEASQGHLLVCAGCKNVFFTPEVTE